MKRRMIAVLLSGILLCSAAGCGKEAVTDKSTAASSSQEVTETPAAEESPEASSSSADSTAESASASTSSESSGDEGKEADKKRIEITVPHKDGMEALYDTVDGLNVEKGSYIAVVAKDLSAGFWKAVKAGAQQALDDLNASLGYTGNDKVYMTFEGPENESDTNSQINIIDSVISENPDALILGIIDQQSGQAQMEEASDSQIPVIIADSGIESDLITSTCATDHAAAAKLAADHLCEAIGNSGEVAIVAHQYNTESSVERVEAFKKEIEEKYTDVKVVQVNYGDGEESIADMLKNTLETYPALKGIFCTNEDMADQTLDALAERFFISKYHLLRKFEAQVGTTVHRYILQKRLLNAKQLLAGGLAPSEVCTYCGFGDYANFYRAFRAEYGTTPRQYVQSLRG